MLALQAAQDLAELRVLRVRLLGARRTPASAQPRHRAVGGWRARGVAVFLAMQGSPEPRTGLHMWLLCFIKRVLFFFFFLIQGSQTGGFPACKSEKVNSRGRCSCGKLTYLQFALQNVEAVLELGMSCGHLGQFGFECGVVLFPEGSVLSRCCQASLGKTARTHGWAGTHGSVGPCQTTLNNVCRHSHRLACAWGWGRAAASCTRVIATCVGLMPSDGQSAHGQRVCCGT